MEYESRKASSDALKPRNMYIRRCSKELDCIEWSITIFSVYLMVIFCVVSAHFRAMAFPLPVFPDS
jgi:hypothetical protein